MVLGWIDLVKRRIVHRSEFVSADARRLSNDPRTYEMLTSNPTAKPILKSPDAAVMSPQSFRSPAFSPDDISKTDYFGGDTKSYLSPVQSFSKPRPPISGQGREWDPRATHARGDAFAGPDLSKNFSV